MLQIVKFSRKHQNASCVCERKFLFPATLNTSEMIVYSIKASKKKLNFSFGISNIPFEVTSFIESVSSRKWLYFSCKRSKCNLLRYYVVNDGSS